MVAGTNQLNVRYGKSQSGGFSADDGRATESRQISLARKSTPRNPKYFPRSPNDFASGADSRDGASSSVGDDSMTETPRVGKNNGFNGKFMCMNAEVSMGLCGEMEEDLLQGRGLTERNKSGGRIGLGNTERRERQQMQSTDSRFPMTGDEFFGPYGCGSIAPTLIMPRNDPLPVRKNFEESSTKSGRSLASRFSKKSGKTTRSTRSMVTRAEMKLLQSQLEDLKRAEEERRRQAELLEDAAKAENEEEKKVFAAAAAVAAAAAARAVSNGEAKRVAAIELLEKEQRKEEAERITEQRAVSSITSAFVVFVLYHHRL